MSDLTGFQCDTCGVRYGPRAVGLVKWLSLVIGMSRSDGGGHEDDKDFCSQECLEIFLKHKVLDDTHPYHWKTPGDGNA